MIRRCLYLLENTVLDGPTRSAWHLGSALARTGIRMAAWFRKDGPAIGDFSKAGFETAIRPRHGLFFLNRSSGAALRALAPEIIHAQTASLAPSAVRLARAAGAAPLASAHRPDDPANRRLAKLGASLTVTAVSNELREQLANRHGVSVTRLRVLPNSLDLRLFPSPSFRERPARVIGAWGRLARAKGQRILLHAVARLVGRGHDVEALLLGDGPDRAHLRGLARDLGIASRLTFSPQSTTGALAEMDILVEPSLQEGFGLTALQAMAIGVPVVATNAGGLFSLVKDGETGLTVPAGDIDALAAAVERLLADASLRMELARAARRRVECDFDASRIARLAISLYDDCIRRMEGRP